MVFVNKTLVISVSLALCVVAACRNSTEPDPSPLSGSFALTRINGRVLPDTEAIQLGPDSSKTNCVILRTSGSLTVNRATGQFSIVVNAQSTCTGEQWVLLSEVGSYTQAGPSLSMTETFPDHVSTFAGEIDDQVITVHGVFYDYAFAR